MARTSEFSCAQAAGSVQSFCVQTDKLLGIHSHCLKNNTHRISLKAGLEKINAKKPPKSNQLLFGQVFLEPPVLPRQNSAANEHRGKEAGYFL